MADAVVDTTVLIAFARLGQLDLLFRLYDRVLAPDAVYREAVRHSEYPEVAPIREAFEAGMVEVPPRESAAGQPEIAGLGAGESAAIAAARELGAVVVLDDAQARRVARSLGLRVVGTVGVLIQARRRGLVPAVLPLLSQLEASGFRIGPRELEAARAEDDS